MVSHKGLRQPTMWKAEAATWLTWPTWPTWERRSRGMRAQLARLCAALDPDSVVGADQVAGVYADVVASVNLAEGAMIPPRASR